MIRRLKRLRTVVARELHVRFLLEIPFLKIETVAFYDYIDRIDYAILAVRIKILKWKFQFELTRKPIWGRN